MWVLLSLAQASQPDPACTWTWPLDDLTGQWVTLGEDSALLSPARGTAVAVHGTLPTGQPPALALRLETADVWVVASVPFDEHYLGLAGAPLRYDDFGTLPFGAALYVVDAAPDAVTVQPPSVHLGEIRFPDSMRTLPCAALGPQPQIPKSTLQPANGTTRFDLSVAFTLTEAEAGGTEIDFVPGRYAMHLARAAEGANRSRYHYVDRFGASWEGWIAPSTLRYIRNLGSGLRDINRGEAGFGGGVSTRYRCTSPAVLRTRKGAEVGGVYMGGTIMGWPNQEALWVMVPWLSERLRIDDGHDCVLLPD